MKTKTLIIFLLLFINIVGALFSASNSFAYSPIDQTESQSGGWGGGGCPGCYNETPPPPPLKKEPEPPLATKLNYITSNGGIIYFYCNKETQTSPGWVPYNSSTSGLGDSYNSSISTWSSSGTASVGSSIIQTYAINYQTQAECRKENNARPQDSCVVDNSTCKYGSDGCTDSKAGNYNPNATTEDGSCLYPSGQIGCTDKTAINYNPQVSIDDGTCTYATPTPTSCLKETNGNPIVFGENVDFTNMTTFNSLYKLCSNGGIYTKTTLSLTWNGWSFSGYCENSTSVDNNTARCTYQILFDDIVIEKAPFSITGTVSGSNTGGDTIINSPLPGIRVVLLTSTWVTQSATTDSAGGYIFNGLPKGEYSLRPENSMPYIFPNSESIVLSDSNATINFYWINTSDNGFNKIENTANLLNKDSSIDEWLKDLSDKWNQSGGNLPDALDVATLSSSRGNGNIFSNNSLSSLFNNGFLPLSNSYTPIPLSLVPKYADKNSVCGDQIKQTGETCDDGINNGKSGYCSSDCLYIGEVKFVEESVPSNTDTIEESENIVSLETLSNISENFSGGMEILQTSIQKASDSISESQNLLKQKIIENTSPKTREMLKKSAEVIAEVAQYSVIAIASVLWVWTISLSIMAYKANWVSYVVKAGDTLDSIGSQFTMTERAMRAKNGLKKWELRPGTKIKVRNRHFIEKDYLDQLKFVLKDSLEKRNLGKMSAKIEKMFAKK
jgi:hypothetical protein